MPPRLSRSFFDRSVHEVAPELIGATFLFNGTGGVIVEVEAYHHTDPAAHSFNGKTERNAVMFGPPGYSYVYRSYGIHWCVNFVCEAAGSASAILIRALQPTHGIAAMKRRRGLDDERLLCAGPGRLCQALGITHAHNGLRLDRAPFELRARTRSLRNRDGHPHRHQQGRRTAVALRTEGIEISEQTVSLSDRGTSFNRPGRPA